MYHSVRLGVRQAGQTKELVMRLTPAHEAALEESISEICTDRLWRVAIESTKVPPLPAFSVWVRGRPYEDRRTLWQRLMRVPEEIPMRRSFPKWEIRYKGVGRKGRRLVVILWRRWEVEGD